MIGVSVHSQSKFTQALASTNQILDFLSGLDENSRQIYADCGGKDCIAKLSTQLSFYERCAEVEKQFRSVTLDLSAKRLLKDTKGNQYEVPLIFRSALPSAPVTKIKRGDVLFAAKTPSPTPEAMDAIKQHARLFDGLEVWWVPKDVLVERIPKPDPILIGRIGPHVSEDKMNVGTTAFFELHRWIDELVEEGWWSKEAY